MAEQFILSVKVYFCLSATVYSESDLTCHYQEPFTAWRKCISFKYLVTRISHKAILAVSPISNFSLTDL